MTRQILLLSHPRSGSSWLGSVLAGGRGVVYRREPVLTARSGEVADPFGAVEDPRALAELVDAAFTAPADATVVVKEVTPLLLPALVQGRNVTVIHLRRHPGDVAASHLERGWRPSERLINRRGITERARRVVSDGWRDLPEFAQLVAYFGAVDASIEEDATRAAAIEVRYEDLVRRRLGPVTEVFESLGLDGADLERPEVDADRADPYGVGSRRRRTTSPWRGTPEASVAREAWLATGARGYSEARLWDVPAETQDR